MKRGLAEKRNMKSKTPLGRIEFVLLPQERKVPKTPNEFDGYYEGAVHIVASSQQKKLANSKFDMTNKGLLSCAPYFLMATTKAVFDEETKTIEVENDDVCELVHLKHVLDATDLVYLAKEVFMRIGGGLGLMNLACSLIKPGARMVSAAMMQMPFMQPGGVLYELSDIHRLSTVALLHSYLFKDRLAADQKRQKRLYDLPTERLNDLVTTLKTKPWDLVWYSPPLHKGISNNSYDRALRAFGANPPQHIKYALIIYFDMVKLRAEEKHTVFRRSSYSAIIPCMAREAREEMERQVYGYLTANDVRLVGTDHMAIAYDYDCAVSACTSLRRFNINSICKPEPERRGIRVPQIPPVLTHRQTQIAQHILHNWLTVVEGLPGTGKTSLITWVFSHYHNVMMVSFVGMMVKSLQKRNGQRKEAACTIHYLLALKKYCSDDNEAVDRWFEMFEVLVIDEFSNVSMSLFSKLLALFPNVSKVVFVGDHRQLKPIDCGDPMGDIIGMFGSHLLVDNLRVEPGLHSLQEAPRLITLNRAREIAFDPQQGPISFVRKDGLEYDDVLSGIFTTIASMRNGRSVLNTHIVVLSNGVRRALNKACEKVWNSLGVVRIPRGGGVRVGGLRLYVGCKITFTKNYNQSIARIINGVDYRSDPVANGELAVIKSIVEFPEGVQMKIVDTEDENDSPQKKTVWVHVTHGVHPKHVDLGYATTTYKTQGRPSLMHAQNSHTHRS